MILVCICLLKSVSIDTNVVIASYKDTHYIIKLKEVYHYD